MIKIGVGKCSVVRSLDGGILGRIFTNTQITIVY